MSEIQTKQAMTEANVSIPSNLIETMQRAAFEQPRNEAMASQNANNELEVVPGLASKAYYSIPYNLGKTNETRVEGVSIRGAQALSRFWKNNITSGRFVEEDNSFIYVEGIYYDIENNIIKIQPQKVSKFYTPRGSNARLPLDATMLRNATHSGISKAIRNAVLHGIPEWVKEGYFNKAKELILKPKAVKGQVVKSIQERIVEGKKRIMKDFNVTEEEMSRFIEDDMGSCEDDNSLLVNLIGIYQALKDGEASVDKVFNRGKNKGIQEPQEKK